jgi:hypothetical protein
MRCAGSVPSLYWRLSYCNLNVDASRRFKEFVQRECNLQGPHGNRVGKLHVLDCMLGMDERTSRNQGEMLGTMLIDLALQVLQLDGVDKRIDYVAFFDALTAHAASIQIPTLQLAYLTPKEMRALARYLATCLHLQELIVKLAPASDHSLAFCRAVYYNASLYRAHIQIFAANTRRPTRTFRHAITPWNQCLVLQRHTKATLWKSLCILILKLWSKFTVRILCVCVCNFASSRETSQKG